MKVKTTVVDAFVLKEDAVICGLYIRFMYIWKQWIVTLQRCVVLCSVVVSFVCVATGAPTQRQVCAPGTSTQTPPSCRTLYS